MTLSVSQTISTRSPKPCLPGQTCSNERASRHGATWSGSGPKVEPMYHSLDQIMMFNPRIAKEVEHLVDSLNKTYNELSRMQADYLSMQTSDDKWGAPYDIHAYDQVRISNCSSMQVNLIHINRSNPSFTSFPGVWRRRRNWLWLLLPVAQRRT